MIGSSGKTIAQIGCATTGIAMLESYRTGSNIYPDAMSRKIIADVLPLGVKAVDGLITVGKGQRIGIFAGSGVGKSTHTGLWRELLGSRAVMVNDDKPLLKITEKGIFAYGTPWDGKHRLSTNISVPLKAICVLTRDTDNHIAEIQPKEAYQMLLQQSYRPMDRNAMMQSLKLIDEMMKKTKFYRLGCNMKPEAARVAFEGMSGVKEEV